MSHYSRNLESGDKDGDSFLYVRAALSIRDGLSCLDRRSKPKERRIVREGE